MTEEYMINHMKEKALYSSCEKDKTKKLQYPWIGPRSLVQMDRAPSVEK